MKKSNILIRIALAITALLLVGVIMTGCSSSSSSSSIDYSGYEDYEFTDVQWYRDGDNCVEYLILLSDGSFSYYDSNGNPIDDSDTCDTYSYDSESGTFTFYYEDGERTASLIYSESDFLIIDFDDEDSQYRVFLPGGDVE